MNFFIVATVLLAFGFATISVNGNDCGNVGKNKQNEMSKDEMKNMFGKVADCGCDKLAKDATGKTDCKKCAKETAANKGKISNDCQNKLPKEVAPCIQMLNSADITDEQIDKAVTFMNKILAVMPADITQAKKCPCEAMDASLKFMKDTAEEAKEDGKKVVELAKKFYSKVLKDVIKDVKCALDAVMKNKDKHIDNCKKFAKEDLGMDNKAIDTSCDCGKGILKIATKKKE